MKIKLQLQKQMQKSKDLGPAPEIHTLYNVSPTEGGSTAAPAFAVCITKVIGFDNKHTLHLEGRFVNTLSKKSVYYAKNILRSPGKLEKLSVFIQCITVGSRTGEASAQIGKITGRKKFKKIEKRG